jgi:hypothetical protein
VLGQEGAGGCPLVDVDRRPHLHHLASTLDGEPQLFRCPNESLNGRFRLGVVDLPVVERGCHARLRLESPGPVHRFDQLLEQRCVLRYSRVALETMNADVRDVVEPDDPPCVGRRPPTDAGHEPVAPGQPLDFPPGLLRNCRVLRALDDGRESAVDVEQDGRSLRLAPESHQPDGGAHRVGHYDTAVRLVLIGLAAGFFSALFGVGGGIVIVPLLMLLLRYEPRLATGTSLAAIGIIALAGTIAYGVRGEVDLGYAALVGLPAAAGAVVGAALQQRMSQRALAFAFSLLLVGVGIALLV